MKIIDKINQVYAEGGTTVSFEFFPAKTEAGVNNLLQRVEAMNYALHPTFVTLTWRSAFKDEKLWLKIGSIIQREFGIDVLLHLTCHLPRDDLVRILQNARDAGIQNILALRGDPPIGSDKWQPVPGGFSNAGQLVQLIRELHGDYFCVAVAAYPEVHTECWNNPDLPPSEQSMELELSRLKLKVEAGADFIITQFFYDAGPMLDYIERCREVGVDIPILPGYLPVQNYSAFKKFTTWCKTGVPESLSEALEAIKDDDEAVKAYGVEEAIRVCRTMMGHGVKSLHFYTMNLAAAVTGILKGLNLMPQRQHRALPWTTDGRATGCNNGAKGKGNGGGRGGRGGKGVAQGQAQQLSLSGDQRPEEDVRPIFWANRQTSYVSRTMEWDEYPNGRWGDSRSPAYGELTSYYLAFKRPKVDRRTLWGVPSCEKDVWDVFAGYVDGSVSQLPWCEQGLAIESGTISTNLRFLNQHGFLTINSQPRVNCVASTDPVFGWGGPDGYVFQKAYVEFFCSPDNFQRLLSAFARYPNLSYHGINRAGQEHTNCTTQRVSAVTWGVFPGREIVQPTVVDPASFAVWKDEAFELWLAQWKSTYDKPAAAKKAAATTATSKKKVMASAAAPAVSSPSGSAGSAATATAATPPQGGGGGGAEQPQGGGSGSGAQVSEEEAAAAAADAKAKQVIQSIHDSYFLVNVVDNDYCSSDANVFTVFKDVIASSLSPDQLIARVRELETQGEQLHERLARLTQLHQETTEELSTTAEQLATAMRENGALRAERRELQMTHALTS